MSTCASCGLPLFEGNLCPHHTRDGGDWHVGNRIFCNFIHRKVEPPPVVLDDLYQGRNWDEPVDEQPRRPVRREGWRVPRRRGWTVPPAHIHTYPACYNDYDQLICEYDLP